MNANRNILLFLKIPPPITGATLINKRVYDSKLLSESFIVRKLPISYAKDTADLGSINLRKLFTFITLFIKLLNELLVHRPAIVYFQISPFGFAFYRDIIFVSILKLFRTNILFHLHGKGIKKEVETKWKRILYKYAFNGSDIICLSDLLTPDIEDVFSGTIHIVNNGLPDTNTEYLSLKKDSDNDKINILFLSNLFKSKGIIDFITALKILDSKGLDFKAVVVGAEGDFTASELNSIIAEANLQDKITYSGAKYDEEKNVIIAASDILVFPTKNDIWGNVIIEAMQFKLPVIAAIEGAIPEIIDDGITGFLVEKGSPDQLAEKVELLARNPALRVSMGNAARKKYEEKYTLEIFEQNMKNVFEKVLTEINGEKNV
jgi:glycosyltransferase involved in cell wall biosynthesis